MDLIDASNEIDIDIAHLLIQGNHCWKTRKLVSYVFLLIKFLFILVLLFFYAAKRFCEAPLE